MVETAAIARKDAAREHLLMNLRLTDGIDLCAFRARWNTAPADTKISALVAQGLLEHEDDHLRATPRGRLLLNSVIAALAD
jgi:oxygen-independent coproporphyrinogen-3 oxidase